MGGSYYSKAKGQEDDYHNFVQKFLFLLNKIREKNKSIHTAVANFNVLCFLIKHNTNFNEDEVYKAIIQDYNSIARPELQDEAKKVLNGYIENGVETVSIYRSCAEIELRANKHEFKISEFLNSNFCKDNGILGFSTLHSNGKSGIHGFVSEEGIRYYIVTDGSYEMTLNWYDKDGKKCTIIINIDASGIELIERNSVTDDQLKANKDVKIGNLFLYQIKFKNKEEGNHKSSETVIENGNRNINIQTTQEIECDSKETQISATKMQDKSTQAIDDSLNEEINKLEKENTRLTEDKEAILEQFQQKVREVEELNGKVRKKDEALAEVTQKLKQPSDELESEFEKRRIEKEELELKLMEARKKIQKLSEEKAELVQEKQGLEEYAKVLVVKRQTLIDQIGRSDLKLNESINENKRLEQELNDTKKELDDKYSEIQRLESQSHELESQKITELEMCLAEKEKKIAELEVQLGEEESKASDLRSKSWSLEEDKRQLKQELSEEKAKVAHEKQVLEELNNKLEEKETEYSNRIKELKKCLKQEVEKNKTLQNYSRALEEESQNYSEQYKKLLSERHILEEEISRLEDQSSLAPQDYMSSVQDLVKDMICLFKENAKEGGNVIILKETVTEIFGRFDELLKREGVSNEEIKEMIEEASEQMKDSPASLDILLLPTSIELMSKSPSL
ncbi:Chromosome partition protein Smc [Wolbachia endosymbiont of Armadillidium vulgare]|nr:Chromosome partition protein Smc [Wolbachia endosymbiont of Armadillidium vulgare]OJH32436.1 Chromosome partition protein Smc [Wolbachia endosymbiont of Armadillidium vulgare]